MWIINIRVIDMTERYIVDLHYIKYVDRLDRLDIDDRAVCRKRLLRLCIFRRNVQLKLEPSMRIRER